MAKKKKPGMPPEFPQPEKRPDIKPGTIPENPVLPEEEPEIKPEEEQEDPHPPAEIPPPDKKDRL